MTAPAWVSDWTPRAHALLRIVTAYLFLLHGTAKLFKVPHVAMFDNLQLFSLAASHIDRLLRDHAAEGLHIVCDRHGGRSHYASLLRLMFEDWDLTVLGESETRADYLLRRDGGWARLSFSEKADAHCLPTAMASMVAKYLRERLMDRFNAFWRAHAPELKPTAGYWNDGLRFLDDIGPLRRKLRIEDAKLIRQR